MKISLLYICFAILSIGVNILTQDILVRLIPPGFYPLLVSVAGGTLAGLVLKYVLDKKFIFGFRAQNRLHDGKTFVLYTSMGIITTLIFWSFEFGFHFLFQSKHMRYIGGIIGLVIGYYLKYHLDKRYVFVDRTLV